MTDPIHVTAVGRPNPLALQNLIDYLMEFETGESLSPADADLSIVDEVEFVQEVVA